MKIINCSMHHKIRNYAYKNIFSRKWNHNTFTSNVKPNYTICLISKEKFQIFKTNFLFLKCKNLKNKLDHFSFVIACRL